jgi:hypothetical protein
MAHHLVPRHPPPATATLRAHGPQPLEDFGLVALPGQGLHAHPPDLNRVDGSVDGIRRAKHRIER